MTHRTLLISQLSKAWAQTLDNQYEAQLVNSERALQVYFCHHLLHLFELDEVATARRLFVEPTFLTEQGRHLSPDLVVCHTRSIIAVIELKYRPRGGADVAKDIQTLEWFDRQSSDLMLANDRYRGVGDQGHQSYSLAGDAVLCWAGVYHGQERVSDTTFSNLKASGRFLGLHALTASGQSPTLTRS